MAVGYKTPGVYIEEKNAFPNSVVAVQTAVPAFIGYTEQATKSGKSITNKPTRVTSLVEFMQYFGGGPNYSLEMKDVGEAATSESFPVGGKNYEIQKDDADTKNNFMLFDALRLFYFNGGGPCYIVSVGAFKDGKIEKGALDAGVKTLVFEEEPTMVLAPDALMLEAADYHSITTTILAHCKKMQSRIGIFDVHKGSAWEDSEGNDLINGEAGFRAGVGTNFLSYGAAYYPWLNTNVVTENQLTYKNIKDHATVLTTALSDEADLLYPLTEGDDLTPEQQKSNDKNAEFKKELEGLANADSSEDEVDALNQKLKTISPSYKGVIMKEMLATLNLLAPSSAMAGVYTAVDNYRGVWKAPANVSLNSVISPSVNINADQQEDLNVPLNGKAVNAIRTFPGQGVIVWGARTLDGNSQDWRYINVRRTLIFLEQSIKAASKAYVFEPNTSSTWSLMQNMINNFLTGVWKAGGLAGSSPGEAFNVQVGLGTTMTANDILDGYMRITVLVAPVRPAEFIVITFQQKMQES